MAESGDYEGYKPESIKVLKKFGAKTWKIGRASCRERV